MSDANFEQIQARRDLISDIDGADYYLGRFDAHVAEYGNHSLLVQKVGGGIVGDSESFEAWLDSTARLAKLGFPSTVVHGGGDQANAALEAAGIPTVRKEGLRVTSPEAVTHIVNAFGEVNEMLVHGLQERGIEAVGLRDVLSATYIDQDEYGEVGRVSGVDHKRITELTRDGKVPIIWCLGQLTTGGNTRILNINGDDAAAAVVTALRPDKYFSVTPTGGILDKEGQLIHVVRPDTAERLIEEGVIVGGMEKKVRELLNLFATHAVRDTVMLKPQNIVRELFTHEGEGTLLTSGDEMTEYDAKSFAGVNKDSIRQLIEESFDGVLDDDYFEKIKLKKAIITAQRYDGVGITTFPDDPTLTDHGISYLDKLAVAPRARGRNVARQILDIATNGGGLFWRTSLGNPYRDKYEEFADGEQMVANDHGKWHVFWKNISEELVPRTIEYAREQPVTIHKNA